MRRNPYVVIHKAIRRRLFEVAVQAGSTDFDSPAATEAFRAEFRGLAGLLAHHGEHEDQVIHPLLKQSGGLAVVDATELEHRRIDELIARVEAAIASASRDGHAVYLACCELTARYLDHLRQEETVVLDALRGHLGDDDFAALVRSDYGGESPDRLGPMLRRMDPAFGPEDRAQICEELALVMSPDQVARVRHLAGWDEEP